MSEAQTVPEGLDFDMADRLRKALRFADISVQEMADELGMSRNSIGRYINGHIHPDLRTLRIWSWKTRVPLDWLTGDDDPRSGHKLLRLRDDLGEDDRPPSTEEILSFRKQLHGTPKRPNRRIEAVRS